MTQNVSADVEATFYYTKNSHPSNNGNSPLLYSVYPQIRELSWFESKWVDLLDSKVTLALYFS
jgi:hypothetical protein